MEKARKNINSHHHCYWIAIKQSNIPIAHTNWEGNGVQPDVRVAAGAALRMAMQTLLAVKKPAAAG